MNKELERHCANPMSHHYAFHVSDAEFDAILQRVGGAVSQPDPRDYPLILSESTWIARSSCGSLPAA